jgi:predicted alpha/beta hydrolase family esterase
MRPAQCFIIPGLGDSGPEHWQTWFETQIPNARRIQQQEWDAPALGDWLQSINEALATADLFNTVLIGHSLGCATIAHWAKQTGKKIRGAMLVAPSDIEQPVYTFPATGFTPIPLDPLPFPSLVVCSADDPWVSPDRAQFFADHWGSELVNIGNAGHINAASGHYKWREGLALFNRL